MTIKARAFCLLTCNPLHLHAPGLDATLGQPLLGDDATDVVGEDEVGLQDGQRLGVGVGAGLMDDDVQCPAVVLDARHLHVLRGRGGRRTARGNKEWGSVREITQQERWSEVKKEENSGTKTDKIRKKQ